MKCKAQGGQNKTQMAKLKNIEKVANGLGIEWDSFGDGSGTWIEIENNKLSVSLCFCGKGEKFEGIKISKKVWQVVDEPIIAEIKVR